ncbi:MAG: hypothetical protein H0Z35_13855 [Thermoanaerobacteraceae bacterium]|nr:hypothetical protein [Thermoanaerobacteraceae bacterium]
MRVRGFVLIWVFIIIIAILGALFTRLSYKDYAADAAEKIGGFRVLLSGIDLENNDWKSFQQLKKEAEYVLKIKKIGESKYQYQTVLSKVQVINVYKGDQSLVGKYIYIYEPSFFDFKNKFYFVTGGYNIMLSNKEYIVFLNKRKFPEGYKPDAVEQNSFLFTTNNGSSNALGKYLLNNNFQSEVLDLSNERYIQYDDIRDLEVIATEKDQLEYYNNFKKQVLESYLESSLVL